MRLSALSRDNIKAIRRAKNVSIMIETLASLEARVSFSFMGIEKSFEIVNFAE